MVALRLPGAPPARGVTLAAQPARRAPALRAHAARPRAAAGEPGGAPPVSEPARARVQAMMLELGAAARGAARLPGLAALTRRCCRRRRAAAGRRVRRTAAPGAPGAGRRGSLGTAVRLLQPGAGLLV
jgi:hypothetical protein